MRPIVNVSLEDLGTDTGNMHKQLGKDRSCGSEDILSDRQTHSDPQTDILVTIFRNHSRGRSKDNPFKLSVNYCRTNTRKYFLANVL